MWRAGDTEADRPGRQAADGGAVRGWNGSSHCVHAGADRTALRTRDDPTSPLAALCARFSHSNRSRRRMNMSAQSSGGYRGASRPLGANPAAGGRTGALARRPAPQPPSLVGQAEAAALLALQKFGDSYAALLHFFFLVAGTLMGVAAGIEVRAASKGSRPPTPRAPPTRPRLPPHRLPSCSLAPHHSGAGLVGQPAPAAARAGAHAAAGRPG